MSEEDNNKEDKSLPEMKDAEYHKKISDAKQTLWKNEESKKSVIKDLAKFLEDKEYPKESISAKLGDDLKGYATKRYIQLLLEPEQKQEQKPRKKKEEKVSEDDMRNTSQVDDKKVLVDAATGQLSTEQVEPEEPNFSASQNSPQTREFGEQQQQETEEEVRRERIELFQENKRLKEQLGQTETAPTDLNQLREEIEIRVNKADLFEMNTIYNEIVDKHRKEGLDAEALKKITTRLEFIVTYDPRSQQIVKISHQIIP